MASLVKPVFNSNQTDEPNSEDLAAKIMWNHSTVNEKEKIMWNHFTVVSSSKEMR